MDNFKWSIFWIWLNLWKYCLVPYINVERPAITENHILKTNRNKSNRIESKKVFQINENTLCRKLGWNPKRKIQILNKKSVLFGWEYKIYCTSVLMPCIFSLYWIKWMAEDAFVFMWLCVGPDLGEYMLIFPKTQRKRCSVNPWQVFKRMRSPLINLRCLSQKWASGIITDKKKIETVKGLLSEIKGVFWWKHKLFWVTETKTVILSASLMRLLRHLDLFSTGFLHLKHFNFHRFSLCFTSFL